MRGSKYPTLELSIADLPNDVGTCRVKNGIGVRYFFYEDKDEIVQWIRDQITDKVHLILTGALPSWLATAIGCEIPCMPLVMAITVRSADNGKGFLAWERPDYMMFEEA